jgi:alpha-glucoside transport system permease protein
MFVIVLVGVPILTAGYIVLVEQLLSALPDRQRPAVRPWLWLAPALALLAVFLIYPTLRTIVLSFYNATSQTFVGLTNYQILVTDEIMITALRNNVLWIVFFTAATVGMGLLIAVLADRVRYESAVKAMIFLPMAISFVAAGVIWRFMYEYRPPGAPQTGTINAFLSTVWPGFEPQAWLINAPWNNIALMVVAAWIWTGFNMVILSAALKGIPPELLEAARVDGANELEVFRFITIPTISSTLAVVTTTMVIFALKAFDIVYVMTNGNFDTEVIANRMYKEMFNYSDYGRAAAIAVVLLLAIVPVMIFNIRRFRAQEEVR